MPKKNIKWTVIGNVITVVIAVVLSFIGDSGVLDFLSKPDVRFLHTIPLKLNDGFAQGIVISNKGNKAATNIMLKIVYSETTTIEYFETQDFEKNPIVEQGGQGEHYVILKIERLVGESRGNISLLLEGQAEEPEITVPYDDGKGIKENDTNKSSISQIPLIIGIVIISLIIPEIIYNILKRLKGLVND